MIYREAVIDDVANLRKLALLSYGRFQPDLTEENWNKLKTHLIAETLFPGLLRTSRSFVCEHYNELVGMAFLVPKGNPTEIFAEDWSYIRMVGVHPDFGGNGIGKKLTEMCIDFARRTNEKVITLHTSEYMNTARHIYESLGFKRFKELEKRYGKRYWLYQLEL